MRPADCLERLWELARAELSAASSSLGSEERARMSRFTVEYRTENSSSSAPAFRSILEAARYDWRDGLPCIKLFRLPAACPKAVNEPDLVTQPELDACLLAHELGHFRADPRGALTQTSSSFRRAGLALTSQQKQTLIEDEREAWRLARSILSELGCTDLLWFDDFANEKIRGHECDLAVHRDEKTIAQPGGESMSRLSSSRA